MWKDVKAEVEETEAHIAVGLVLRLAVGAGERGRDHQAVAPRPSAARAREQVQDDEQLGARVDQHQDRKPGRTNDLRLGEAGIARGTPCGCPRGTDQRRRSR